MSPTQYKKVLEQELRLLNKRIDFKIVHGLAYKSESQKHQQLIRKMRTLKPRKPFFQSVTAFLF